MSRELQNRRNDRWYGWHGTDSLGLPQHGRIQASSYDHANGLLAQNGVRNIILKGREHGSHADRRVRWLAPSGKARINKKELAFFSRQLASLLTVGIPVMDALDTLEADSTPRLQVILRAVKASLGDGLNLGDALAKHSETFDGGYLALVRSGEAAGELGPALTALAESYERAQHFRRHIRQAFMQPGLILVTAAAATWMLLAFVMPEFAAMFAQQKRSLPEITQWVIQLSETIEHQGKWWLFGTVVSAMMGLWSYRYSTFARLLLDGLVLRAPVAGNLSQCANTASMCRTLAATVGAGVAINKALPFAADACGNGVFQRAVNGLVSQLENGTRLHDAMAAEPCFPTTLQRMIRLGEESGKLDHMLQQATEFHEEKLRRTVSNLLPLIEPLLMVLLGFVVGGLILAMYLPIFAMGDLFQS